jgi:hypothetical protein
VILRSALFGIVGRGRRRHLNNEAIASLNGTELRQTGEQLDQSDESVWMTLVRRAREHGLGSTVTFSLRSLLKDLGWDSSGKSIARLRATLDRLVTVTIEIKSDRGKRYIGHLVHEGSYSREDDSYWFRLSANLADFFAPSEYSLLSIRERAQLHGSLSKWLHGFISSSPSSFPAKIDLLCELSGSAAIQRYHFTRTLKDACQELVSCGFLESFRIEHATLYVKRAQHLKLS